MARQAEEREKEIGRLDELGERQLADGLVQDAAATIKRIVALNPPNSAVYLDLLVQLGG
jgi:Flp pilus assembly protein TadD